LCPDTEPTIQDADLQLKRLVLVGMRAAGKSTLGRVAATRLGVQFVDLDEVLEQEVFGCKINAFVDKHGWAKFREAEARLLEDVVVRGLFISDPRSGCVVATGGGVIETPSALSVLKAHTPVIWIDRHIDDIIRCLEGVGSYRPGLGTPPREIYAKRRPLYEQCSDFVFTMRCGDDNWLFLEKRFADLAAWADRSAAGCRGLEAANPVCVPIVAASLQAALDDVAEAAIEGAGLVELRVDKLTGGVEAVLEALPKLLRKTHSLGLPAVVTFRPTWEDPNAGYIGDETPRLQALRRAAELGAAFIDVERAAVQRWAGIGGLPKGSKARLIISSHNFTEVLDLSSLRALVAEMRGSDAKIAGAGPESVVKIAQMAQSSADAARMLTVLREQAGQPTVALAMGEAGVFTRILAPHFGAIFSFGCLSGRASAPGQPDAIEMLEVYRLGAMSGHTKVFALLGDPVAGSGLPKLLNAGFAADAWNAVFVGMLVRGCSVEEFLEALPSGLIAGAAVLASHSEAALKAAAEHDASSARRARADALLPKSGGGYVARGLEDGLVGEVAEASAYYELFKGSPVPSIVRDAMMLAAAAQGRA